MSIALMFPWICAVPLGCLRWFRFRLERIGFVTSHREHTVPMRDLFLITGGIAAVLAMAVPFRALALQCILIGSLLSSFLLLPVLPGLLALSANRRLVRFLAVVAVVLAGMLIVEITISLWVGYPVLGNWTALFMLGRYIAFLFVATFALASVLRHGGYVLRRQRNVPAS